MVFFTSLVILGQFPSFVACIVYVEIPCVKKSFYLFFSKNKYCF